MTPNSKAKARRALAAWLAGKRKAAGLSLAQVAERIGHPEAFVARYEANGRLDIEKFVRITEVLDADPHEAITLMLECSGETPGGQDGNRD